MPRRPNQLALVDRLSPAAEGSILRCHLTRRPGAQSYALGYDHAREKRTSYITGKKAELIAGVTDLLVQSLGKRAEDIVVLIEELDPDNWGQGGITASEIRRRRVATMAKHEGEKTS